MSSLKKVLLAEDNDDMRDIYNVTLQVEGFTVEQAINGTQTLEKILSFKPDVLLLDIMMPDIDGLEVLRRLRDNPIYKRVRPRVIIVSNLAQPEIKAEAKKLGADEYAVKSDIEPSQLVEMIRTLDRADGQARKDT